MEIFFVNPIIRANMRYAPEIRVCLFCKGTSSDGACFKGKEHIFSESLGNKTIKLQPGIVCKKCNNHFSQLEREFNRSYPGLFGKFIYTDRNKKGNSLRADLPQSAIKRVKRTKYIYIDGLGEGEADLTPQLMPDQKPVQILTIALPPEDLVNTSRLLAKIALELLYLYSPGQALSPAFDTIRTFARRGPYRDIQFIPYAWKLSLIEPFQHKIIEVANREGPMSLFVWFSLPFAQYLYPLYLPLSSLSCFSGIAAKWGLKIEREKRISDNTYLRINLELAHYSNRQLYSKLIGI